MTNDGSNSRSCDSRDDDKGLVNFALSNAAAISFSADVSSG